jgi:hypothetical protein
MNTTTIRYSAPKNGIGYVTETFCDTSTQSALNIIKARIPNAQISWVRCRHRHQPTGAATDSNVGGGGDTRDSRGTPRLKIGDPAKGIAAASSLREHEQSSASFIK